MKKSVFIVDSKGFSNDSIQYLNMFVRSGWTISKTIKDADLIQFTGGLDMNPKLYGEYLTNKLGLTQKEIILNI